MSTGTLVADPVPSGLDRGARPRLLLLHGYLGSGASWNRVAHELEPFAETFAPDLRGHGKARMHGPGFTLDQVVEDLVPVLWDWQPTHIVGHSMGALVALAAAARANRVRRLGLVGLPLFTSPADGYRHQASAGPARKAVLRVHRWSHPVCAIAGPTSAAWTPVAARFAPRYPRAALRALVDHSAAAHAGALDRVVFAGLGPTLAAKTTLPVALLHGGSDSQAPIGPARELARTHGWIFDPVPGASHHVVYERPLTVARWIARRVLFGGGDQSRIGGSPVRSTMPGQ